MNKRVVAAGVDLLLCEFCGERPARIEKRWCNGNCRRHAIREMAESPTPSEIAARAAEIRAGWSPDEERKRRLHIHGLSLDQIDPDPFTIPEYHQFDDGFDVVG